VPFTIVRFPVAPVGDCPVYHNTTRVGLPFITFYPPIVPPYGSVSVLFGLLRDYTFTCLTYHSLLRHTRPLRSVCGLFTVRFSSYSGFASLLLYLTLHLLFIPFIWWDVGCRSRYCCALLPFPFMGLRALPPAFLYLLPDSDDNAFATRLLPLGSGSPAVADV
jgi:hypothetical protein